MLSPVVGSSEQIPTFMFSRRVALVTRGVPGTSAWYDVDCYWYIYSGLYLEITTRSATCRAII